MKTFKLTIEVINEIKDATHKRWTSDTCNPREKELFLATCYIKSTLDYLVRNDIVDYTENDKFIPYEPTDE